MKTPKPRSPEEAAAVRAEWLAQAQAITAKLAPVGRISLQEMAGCSGLEFLSRIFRGDLPAIPIGETIGMVPIVAERGRIVFQGTPEGRFYNPIGSIHGGFLATMLDSAVGCAVHTVLEQGMGYTTLELKVNYLRALTETWSRCAPRTGRAYLAPDRPGRGAAGRLGGAPVRATTTCLIFRCPRADPSGARSCRPGCPSGARPDSGRVSGLG
jgi:uncharacterized protein (TIGR00369 family)